jgi:hypothetical protein
VCVCVRTWDVHSTCYHTATEHKLNFGGGYELVSLYIYVIYMYLCVCVCVCICGIHIHGEHIRTPYTLHTHYTHTRSCLLCASEDDPTSHTTYTLYKHHIHTIHTHAPVSSVSWKTSRRAPQPRTLAHSLASGGG